MYPADFDELITEEDLYRSRIGFGHFSSNGSEYLEDLLDIYRRCISTASVRPSSDANGTSENTPPQPDFSAGVIVPPPAPPLDAAPAAEPKIVQLEARGTAMFSGAASIRADGNAQAGTAPTGVGSEEASLRYGTDEPPVNSIPQQVTAASQFTLDATGRMDLLPDPPDQAVLADPKQRDLYADLRHKAYDLSDLGHNQLGDLFKPVHRFRWALPESMEAVSIASLWSRGNTLRRQFRAHESTGRSADPTDPARLPPAGR